MSRYPQHARVVALIVACAALVVVGRPVSASAAARQTSSGAEVVTVERPSGQIVVSDFSLTTSGHLALTVTDTRADDPGWTVSVTLTPSADLGWKPYVVRHTAPFADSNGTVYAQDVVAGRPITPGPAGSAGIDGAILGSASPGRGLGIAVLGAKLTAVGHLESDNVQSVPTVTITVV